MTSNRICRRLRSRLPQPIATCRIVQPYILYLRHVPTCRKNVVRHLIGYEECGNTVSGDSEIESTNYGFAAMTLAVPIPSNSRGIIPIHTHSQSNISFPFPPTPVPIISNNYNCNTWNLKLREKCRPTYSQSVVQCIQNNIYQFIPSALFVIILPYCKIQLLAVNRVYCSSVREISGTQKLAFPIPSSHYKLEITSHSHGNPIPMEIPVSIHKDDTCFSHTSG